MKMKKMDTATQSEILASYMARVNKLTLGKRTSDKFFGEAKLVKSARATKKSPTGYGTRKFKISGSKNIVDGTYTLGKLRAALVEAIQA